MDYLKAYAGAGYTMKMWTAERRRAMGELFDLIVVGGGLGGAALARSLAANGARVLVIEREERFRDCVRGEMMTP